MTIAAFPFGASMEEQPATTSGSAITARDTARDRDQPFITKLPKMGVTAQRTLTRACLGGCGEHRSVGAIGWPRKRGLRIATAANHEVAEALIVPG